jgi:hypothetical protein
MTSTENKTPLKDKLAPTIVDIIDEVVYDVEFDPAKPADMKLKSGKGQNTYVMPFAPAAQQSRAYTLISAPTIITSGSLTFAKASFGVRPPAGSHEIEKKRTAFTNTPTKQISSVTTVMPPAVQTVCVKLMRTMFEKLSTKPKFDGTVTLSSDPKTPGQKFTKDHFAKIVDAFIENTKDSAEISLDYREKKSPVYAYDPKLDIDCIVEIGIRTDQDAYVNKKTNTEVISYPLNLDLWLKKGITATGATQIWGPVTANAKYGTNLNMFIIPVADTTKRGQIKNMFAAHVASKLNGSNTVTIAQAKDIFPYGSLVSAEWTPRVNCSLSFTCRKDPRTKKDTIIVNIDIRFVRALSRLRFVPQKRDKSLLAEGESEEDIPTFNDDDDILAAASVEKKSATPPSDTELAAVDAAIHGAATVDDIDYLAQAAQKDKAAKAAANALVTKKSP